MTTIAWDGKTLAADTQGLFKRNVKKLFAIHGKGRFAGAGEYQDVLLAREWLINSGEKPKLDTFEGIFIDDYESKVYRFETKLVFTKVEGCHALGTGRDFAMAAMMCGKTAKESVQIASSLDPDTGGNVEILEYHDEFRAGY